MGTQKLDIFKNLSVLLVEDDAVLRTSLQTTLELFFNQTFIAQNGEEGLSLLEKETIHFIITDYVMPQMDGYRLCKEIRKTNDTIPILMLSNYAEREKLFSVIPLNLVDYLVKPVTYETLVEALTLAASRMDENALYLIPLNETTTYNKYSKVLEQNGKPIKLTKAEIILLDLLISNKGTFVTDQMIDNALGKEKSTTYNATKNIVYRLRNKIGKELIRNVQSLGYRFKDAE
jgi:DNA-binding response OmpR family regulator